MKKAGKIITGVVVVAVLLAGGFFGFKYISAKGGQNENIFRLAVTYADRGEYDRALSLLDTVLIKEPDNQTALDLLNQIISLKNAAGGEVRENPGQDGYAAGGNFTFDLDTNGLTDAMQDFMRDALAESNKQAEENRKAMESLMRRQEQQNAEEEEKKAKEAAAAEQKRLAEEKRKAEEAELAKKNAQLKKEIDAVNDEIQKGKTALATGNIEEAMRHFKNAEGMMPSGAGNVFGASKESEIAQALFDAADKADSPAAKADLLKKAVEMAQKSLEKNPDDPAAHYIIAQDAINGGDYNRALTELTKAVQNDPTNYVYFYDLGKIQYRLKKFSEAASSFSTACDLKGDFAPSRYNLGLTQKQLKNDTAALAAFRKTIDIDPRHEKAHLEEARILSARGDYSGAAQAYETVLKLNNINVSAAMELGSVYYKAGKLSDSEASYRKAITMLQPGADMTLTKYNLSTVLFDEKKFQEAEKSAREAYEGKDSLTNKNSKANVVYNYALILDKNSKTDDAIPLYMEVLEYNPEHLKTKINLGVLYMTIQPPDVDTALALFLQVYNKEKTNFEANNNLGSAYLLKEDYANAVLYFQNALRLDSKNNDVRANLAKAYAKNGDYQSAKATYSELLKLDASNWDAYVELAKVCIQLEDNENAEKYLVYVQEKNPSYKATEVRTLLSGL